VTAPGRDQARAATARLLAGCLRQAEPGAALDVVTAGFRCWTPLDDWQSGVAGLAALRRAMGSCGPEFRLRPIVTDGERAVAEAWTAGGPITFVLTLDSGLVSEVRCYLVPDVAGG
jgi:hypothetical protein